MIDFNYYITKYNGKKIEECEIFEELSKKAKKYVMSVIVPNANDNEIAEAVCAVCDYLYEHEGIENIKSESIDGVSITYNDTYTSKQLYSILKLYLPSRLLYRGL